MEKEFYINSLNYGLIGEVCYQCKQNALQKLKDEHPEWFYKNKSRVKYAKEINIYLAINCPQKLCLSILCDYDDSKWPERHQIGCLDCINRIFNELY